MSNILYQTTLPGAAHWSFVMRRGMQLRLTDVEGGGNVGMVFYNPTQLFERYNAPDTLKAQHTFKLTRGHCLYSDMGRIFASIVEDDLGWHETMAGNSHRKMVAARWGERDYQNHRNDWHQNGFDAFLVELAKYGLGRTDLVANVNWFSKVQVSAQGQMHWVAKHSPAGAQVTLRFEMDTLVLMHTCPHPLDTRKEYPRQPVQLEWLPAEPVQADDYCLNFRPENQRGFENNRIYHLGL